MKKYLLLLVLFTAGCSNTVGPEHMVQAEKLCKNNAGLRSITMGTLRFDVYCNNDAVFNGITKTWNIKVRAKDGQAEL